MAFLNPWMLVGLSGIGIPILIHLLNRYRHRELDWAAMELLRRALERDYEPQREADPLTEDVDVFLLPDDVSYEAATFVEPLACVVRGQRAVGAKPGRSVVVIGGGIAGLLHVQLACALGAGRVFATDISDYRLDAAKRLGADAVINGRQDVPARLRELNDGMLADIVILATGAPKAIEQAFNCLERGGAMLVFAGTDEGATYPLSINDVFWRREVTLVSTYAGDRRDHMQALELIRAGRVPVKDMITHRFPLAEAQKGFALVAAADASLKVIIEPQK